jgi:hypothetical protein
MFDHEKLDVYQLELKFLGWATAERLSSFLAPKGQQDSAQGFNPGYDVLTGCALKGHQIRHALLNPPVRISMRTCSGAAFRAHHTETRYPGLKPWAESYRPFGARNEDSLSDVAYSMRSCSHRLLRRSRKDEDDTGGAGNP